MINYPKFADLIHVHEEYLRHYSPECGCYMSCEYNIWQSRADFEAIGGNTQGCMCKYGKIADENVKSKDWVLPDLCLFEVPDTDC